jgi:hypothetical protein
MTKLIDKPITPLEQLPSEFNDSIEQPRIKLIYRGNIFYYTPCLPVFPEKLVADGEIVTLIYRGSTYQRRLSSDQPYQKPRAINWRWQLPVD